MKYNHGVLSPCSKFSLCSELFSERKVWFDSLPPWRWWDSPPFRWDLNFLSFFLFWTFYFVLCIDVPWWFRVRIRHSHSCGTGLTPGQGSLLPLPLPPTNLPSATIPPVTASQVVLVVKSLPTNAGEHKRWGFDSWVGKIPWRREWQPTLVFLPGESRGQRSRSDLACT